MTSTRARSFRISDCRGACDGMSLPIRPKWGFGTSPGSSADKVNYTAFFGIGRGETATVFFNSRVGFVPWPQAGGFNARSMMSATDGAPDGRWIGPRPPLATQGGHVSPVGTPSTNFGGRPLWGRSKARTPELDCLGLPSLPWSIPHRRWIEGCDCILSI